MEETVLGPSFQQLTFNAWSCGLSEGLSLEAFDFLPPWRETVGEGRRRQFWKEAEGRSGRTVIEEARYGNVGAGERAQAMDAHYGALFLPPPRSKSWTRVHLCSAGEGRG